MSRKPLVSSLSVTFRKAVLPETVEEAKKEHRTKIQNLMEKYMDDIQSGKAEGIRNARDLVEVMKMDLLLMGEATDRTEENQTYDEIRINQVTKALDLDDPAMKELLDSVYEQFNKQNDEEQE